MASLSPSILLSDVETSLRDRLWRGDAMVSSTQNISSGFAALDRELPGSGWPTHNLTELLLPCAAMGEIRLLAPALSLLTQAKREIIVLVPAEQERLIYPDGWAQLGIDVSHLLIIRTSRAADRLWAIEQSLKSAAFGALLAWVPEARPDALRRLQHAATGADGLSFLIRPAAAQQQATPAPLRLLLQNLPQHPDPSVLSVQLLKRRGPAMGRPLVLSLPSQRPLRSRPAQVSRPVHPPTFAAASRHALGRPLLPDTLARSHSAPTA